MQEVRTGMNRVVIGTSPLMDTTVATGPFRNIGTAHKAEQELTAKGYNTEIVDLLALDEIGDAHNDEGATW